MYNIIISKIMKGSILIFLALSLLCSSCNKEDNNIVVKKDKSLVEAANAISDIIAAGAEYDADAISWDKYWYLDALLKYNEDYNEGVELWSDIGGKPWLEELEPVVYITKDKVSRYALTEGGDVVVEQVGDLEFYPRVSKLFVDWKSEDGSVVKAFEANFLAYTDDSFVVEWQSEGVNFRALFKMIDYQVLENRGADVKVDRLVAQAGELDPKSVEERIIGEYSGSIRLEYDDCYAEVCRIHQMPGEMYWAPYAPRFGGSYTFSEDGTITYEVLCADYESGIDEVVTYRQTWSYDAENNKMTIVDQYGETWVYTIVALSDDWLIWDYDEVRRDYNTNEIKEINHLRDGYCRVK